MQEEADNEQLTKQGCGAIRLRNAASDFIIVVSPDEHEAEPQFAFGDTGVAQLRFCVSRARGMNSTTDSITGLRLPCARCGRRFPRETLRKMSKPSGLVLHVFHIPSDTRLFCRACTRWLNSLVVLLALALAAVAASPYWIHYVDSFSRWIVR